jgi:hypothetical protein
MRPKPLPPEVDGVEHYQGVRLDGRERASILGERSESAGTVKTLWIR